MGRWTEGMGAQKALEAQLVAALRGGGLVVEVLGEGSRRVRGAAPGDHLTLSSRGPDDVEIRAVVSRPKDLGHGQPWNRDGACQALLNQASLVLRGTGLRAVLAQTGSRVSLHVGRVEGRLAEASALAS